jgi:hypothetical protein
LKSMPEYISVSTPTPSLLLFLWISWAWESGSGGHVAGALLCCAVLCCTGHKCYVVKGQLYWHHIACYILCSIPV